MSMIVPRSKLLFWVALVVLPYAFLASAVAHTTGISLLFIGGLLLAAVGDAIGAQRRLVGIGVELPPVVRFSRDRSGSLELRIRNARGRKEHIRLAFAWPPEIQVASEEMNVALPDTSEWLRLAWPCTPRKRGNYKLRAAYLEGHSPLGFWAVRRAVPVQSELRVYPNLRGERKNLAALFLNRGAGGLHAQRQVGKGRDFEKVREYIPGDGYDEIHWKATARRGRPITKVFQIEKTQEVYVVVDASRLSARATSASESRTQPANGAEESALRVASPTWQQETSTLERYVTAALILGLAAERQGDLFGVLAFTDKVERFARAKNGQAHHRACRDTLYTLEPKLVTPDFEELCAFIRARLRRRALLVFLTALDDPAIAESFVRNIDLLRRHHLVLVNMLQPQGVAPLFSNPAVTAIDEVYQDLAGHLRWQALRQTQKVLERRGARFSLLADERLSVAIVSQYLNVKQRQLL
jgi:uncharacterized protein (DUF58 family)